ncbi:MAG: DUF2079 domain-containing protein [Myxococcales bacterium]|nr:DUF2079 domain-containing protein [Myxococcales bacterium]
MTGEAQAESTRRVDAAILLCMVAFAGLSLWLAWARYSQVAHRTFDLALYARIAWGLGHGELYNPITDSNFFGGHVPWVLWPLGLLGRFFGTVEVLLTAQSLAFALTAWPLSRIAARKLGPVGALVTAVAWLVHPNLGHVVAYEFHPGSLAALPMALALDAFDREQPRALCIHAALTVACRASLTLQVAALALLWLPRPKLRKLATGLLLGSLAYFTLTTWLLPRWLGEQGLSASAQAHYGHLGGSPLGALPLLFRDPSALLSHFTAPERLYYLPWVLTPLALMPLWAPRLLLMAAPPLLLNLLSAFPTAQQMYSHYLTPALVPLLVAAVEGVGTLSRRGPSLLLFSACSLGSALLWGGLPGARAFPGADFKAGPHSQARHQVLARIAPDRSVQAPDALLPHLAERRWLFRGPPPERGAELVVLDAHHRRRFARREDLLRTVEEPLMRQWLGRPDFGLIFTAGDLLLLEKGADPRAGPARHYLRAHAWREPPQALCACLAVHGATLRESVLELELSARGPCPDDLALRIGDEARPRRVDLAFEGLLSPRALQEGDALRSPHALSDAERARIMGRGLHVGALRSSGARPEPGDPTSVRVPLR